LESWEIDEDLRHMQRMLRGRRYTEPNPINQELRFDAAPGISPPNAIESDGMLLRFRAALATLLVLLGITTTVCGASLLAWWHFGSRAELCAPGLGCTIAGQFLLMIGLAMQPERLGSEAAATKSKPVLAEDPLLYADLNAELGQPAKPQR
jgi:hypothetical protein